MKRDDPLQSSHTRPISGSGLFLDRDGIINVDHGYVHRLDQFDFVPGIFDLARFWTKELKRPIIVITNQSGIGRGYFDESTYAELTRWMCNRFDAEDAPIARVYHCAHHPEHGIGQYRLDHPWRKPRPGMILQAASDLGLELAHCVIVGDKMSDMEAGAAAGIGLCILVRSHDCENAADAPAHELVADLGQALALLRRQFTRAAPAERSD